VGRDAADAELGRHGLVRIDVDLGHHQLALVLLGDFFQDRCNHLARTAPLGPEVDQDRALGLEHFGIEVCIGDVFDIFAHMFLKRGKDQLTPGGQCRPAWSRPAFAYG
jgi:hypothetical protein